jgi:dihydroneopterin aldolase
VKNKVACDRIFIRKLKIPARIGIHAIEQENPQDIYLDLDFEFDSARAAASDDIFHALDYATICKCLSDYIPTTRFNLIEKLAEDLTQLLFKEFPIEFLRLKILKKPFDIKNARPGDAVLFRGGMFF